jgi:hypothetical protein
MLAGVELTEKTREHAREMLDASRPADRDEENCHVKEGLHR